MPVTPIRTVGLTQDSRESVIRRLVGQEPNNAMAGPTLAPGPSDLSGYFMRLDPTINKWFSL